MKTAEDWLSNVEFEIGTRSGILREEFRRVIQQIQLDAFKAGAKWAAEEVQSHKYCGCGQCEIEQMLKTRISNAAEQLTELPKE